MSVRHFLNLDDLSLDELRSILQRARHLKEARARSEPVLTLQNRVLGMIFEKASTRTRVSFEAGMAQLGGAQRAAALQAESTQIDLGTLGGGGRDLLEQGEKVSHGHVALGGDGAACRAGLRLGG